MANPEHLAILKKGAKAWNEWLKKHPDLDPDLSRADLSEADLSRAILAKADLRGANLNGAAFIYAILIHADLSGAYVSKADFRDADLSSANLSGADLKEAKIAEADLFQANLEGADLSRASLPGAHLVGTTLNGAHLSRANLSRANLEAAKLNRADLSGARLEGAKLIEADLHGADLSGARLDWADLHMTHLVEANMNRASFCWAMLNHADLSGAALQDVDVRYGVLCGCNLTGAELTGAKLYGTARDDWIIKGVQCKYVYWDARGKIRSPENRDLAPGEFERLYRTLPTIEYIFQNGMSPMDPLIMDRVVEAIRKQNPEYDIKIDSISARGLAPSIKFTVQQEQHKEPALQMVIAEYESRMQRLEAEKDRLYDLLALAIDKPGTRLLVAGHDIITADGNATINIDQHVEYVTNLRDTIAAQPEDSETFAKVAKKTALDIIGGALKDVAKGQVKKAAEQIIELGKDLGPVILNTAAYAFFKNMMQGG